MKTINMPSFGADMEKGSLTEWLVKPGALISRGDVIAVVETHKGAIELDVYEDGVVDALLLNVGQTVPVGTPLLRIRSQNESPASIQHPDKPAASAQQKVVHEPENASTPKMSSTGEPDLNKSSHITVSPAARRLAEQQGIQLDRIEGSGPNGAVRLQDLKSHLAQKVQPSSPLQTYATKQTRTFDFDGMRQAIAATVTKSKRAIPHYYLSLDLDITQLEEYLARYNASQPLEQRMLLTAPLLCAIARGLTKQPQLNGLYQQERFKPADNVRLANAVNLRGGGLIMPVIVNAEQLDAAQMMLQLSELVDKARTGCLRFSQLNDASFTVTCIGERGADAIIPVIYPPQVAIIGLGRARRAPAVVNDVIEVRSIMAASLAADHRVSDGHQGSRFLHQLNKQLQQPEELWKLPKSKR